MRISLLLTQSLTRRPIRPLSTFALVQPTAALSMSSTKTNPKRPLPDDIAPEAKRQHIEEEVPEPGGEEDWFKGMICQYHLPDRSRRLSAAKLTCAGLPQL